MFGQLRTLMIVAILSGLGAGLVGWGAQMVSTTPTILQAEVYENAAESTAAPATAGTATTAEAVAADGHDHEHSAEAWAPADGWERNLYTLAADVVTWVGFAMLLTAGYVFYGGRVNARRGLIWGLAGFAAFTLAPSIGLPPELPGTEAADLMERQIWWVATVIATIVGLLAIAKLRNVTGVLVGLVFIAAPHVYGAPQPEQHAALAPVELQHHFIAVALGVSLLTWLVLGALSGAAYGRFAAREEAAA